MILYFLYWFEIIKILQKNTKIKTAEFKSPFDNIMW